MTGPRRKSGPYGPGLAKQHAAYLEKRAVSPAVAKERGYRTVKPTDRGLLKTEGLGAAPTPGLLIPIFWNKEVVQHQVRPDVPRESEETGKELKFENPYGRPNRLDCHPSMAVGLSDPAVRLWIAEGVVKADALVSWLEEPVLGITGVDNWRGSIDERGTGPLPEWEDVPLDGRLVVVAFDSDAAWNDGPLGARQRLTVFLHGRGARLRWLYLPQQVKGVTGKVGVDDYLARADNPGEGIERLIGPPRFKINAASGSLPGRTALALTALDLWNEPPSLFRRGRALVEVNAQSLAMEDVEDDRFRNRMARAADWINPVIKDGKKVGEKKVAPPTDVVRDARVQYEDHRFPQLARVVTTPVFAGRPHWTLRTEPGYDAATGNLYIPPKGLAVPSVPELPTKRQASDAVARLLDYIAEFPFLTAADKAHALALMLQPFAREIVRGETPLYVAEAPTEGTGKGLLLDTLLAPGVGCVEALGPKTSEAEIEKNITTAFLESRPVVFFDNWPTGKKFASASVASALTRSRYMSRVLGASKFVSVPNNVVWLLSANNPEFSPEIRRRVVSIRMDAMMPDPKARSGFRYTLPADALENRGQMIHDACTVIAYWLSVGRPGPDGDVPAIGGFKAWRYVMGGILGAVRVPGFLSNLHAAEPEDESFSTEAAAFALITEKVGIRETFTAQSLLSLLDTAAPDLADEMIPEYTREASRARAVGAWLATHKDRVNDGHALRQLSRSASGHRWQLAPV